MKKTIFIFIVILILASCNLGGLFTGLQNSAPWDPRVIYQPGALASENGITYENLQYGNLGHEPATSPSWWSRP